MSNSSEQVDVDELEKLDNHSESELQKIKLEN